MCNKYKYVQFTTQLHRSRSTLFIIHLSFQPHVQFTTVTSITASHQPSQVPDVTKSTHCLHRRRPVEPGTGAQELRTGLLAVLQLVPKDLNTTNYRPTCKPSVCHAGAYAGHVHAPSGDRPDGAAHPRPEKVKQGTFFYIFFF